MPLTFKIDANTGSITKSIEELKGDLVQFRDALNKATDTQTVGRLNKSIKETETALKSIKNIDTDFGKKIVPGANQAASALTNMGRIASDAPFGFIAIQNNLDPLIQSFGYLTRETGSVKGAIKALGSQLAGAGGLALAFSVLSSLITAVIQKYGSFGEAIDVLTSDTGAAANAQRDMANAFSVAAGKAAGEAAEIRALLKVANDNTISRDAQNEAIKKLNSEYDKLLPKITQENKNTDATREAVDKLTDSLLRQAKINGLKDLISKETQKQAEIFSKSLSSNADWLDYIVASAKSLRTGGNFFTDLQLAGVSTGAKNFAEAQKKIDIFVASLTGLITEEAKTGFLFKDTNDALKQRIAALKELQSLTGLTEKQQIELTQLEIKLAKRDQVKIGFTKEELQQKIEGELEKAFPVDTFEYGAPLHLLKVNIGLVPTVVKDAELLSKNQLNDISKATGFDKVVVPVTFVPGKINVDQFGELIGDAFASSLAQVGQDLGKAFATGDFAEGFKASAKSILSIIGDVLIEVGKQIIITSALVKGLKAALSGLFGPGGEAAGIAVGIALITTGAFLKNISFPKMADGGVLTQSTLFQGGEAGKEAIIPLAKLPYLMSQQQQGGSNMSVGLRIKGRELLAFLEREKQYSKRLG